MSGFGQSEVLGQALADVAGLLCLIAGALAALGALSACLVCPV